MSRGGGWQRKGYTGAPTYASSDALLLFISSGDLALPSVRFCSLFFDLFFGRLIFVLPFALALSIRGPLGGAIGRYGWCRVVSAVVVAVFKILLLKALVPAPTCVGGECWSCWGVPLLRWLV
jgi:hypothetical protein